MKVSVSSSVRSSDRHWHRGFSGARRNVIKLVNLLSLRHLFCRPYPHSLSEFDSLVFYYIRPFQCESLICYFFLFFLCFIPQSQLDTVVGPHSIRSIQATRDSVLSNWPLFKQHVLKVTNRNQSYPILHGHFFPADIIRYYMHV